MITLSFSEYPAFSQSSNLDNVKYQLSFKWNYRGEYWSMGIATSDGTQIIGGIKLVMDYELIRSYALDAMPPGEMYVISEDLNIQAVGRYDISNGDVKIVYVPEAEVV